MPAEPTPLHQNILPGKSGGPVIPQDGPRPRYHHLLRICRAERCRAMGSDDLLRHVEERLGIKLNQSTPDGAITFQDIFCLGLCARSPAMMVDDTLIGHLTPRMADALIEGLCNS